jgi:hypothetical protein
MATAASSQATSSAVTAVSDLADPTVTRIASVVAQAVVAAIQSPTPSAGVDTREVPLNGRSETGAQVQGPVASALEHLTGEHVNLQVVRPPSSSSHVPFNSITIPIDAQVSPKIKAKIWANEFIEFGSLLNPYVGETRYQLSLAQSESSGPTLSLEPSSKIKPIYSIDAWTSAFQIFVGVYTSKFPQEAPDLMKYEEVVQDLAARGTNWRFYDTQFRSLRQTRADEMPWGTTHFELWIRAQSFAHISPARSNIAQPSGRTSQLGPFVLIGFCRAFHMGVKCTSCSYKHTCFKCGATHSAKSCNFPLRQNHHYKTSSRCVHFQPQ